MIDRSEMLTKAELRERLRRWDSMKVEDAFVELSAQVATLIEHAEDLVEANRILRMENSELRGDRPIIQLPPNLPPLYSSWLVFKRGDWELARVPSFGITDEEIEEMISDYPEEWGVHVVLWDGVLEEAIA